MQDEIIVEDGRKWEFDSAVTDAFDDMLQRSIPQYPVMRTAVTEIAIEFQQNNTDIVDLGASRGEAIAPIVSQFGCMNRFVLVEVSVPMLAALHERFGGYEGSGVVYITDVDLRYGWPSVKASVVLSILTLQFIPIEYRQKILSNIYKSMVPGGAFILVEKVLGNSDRLDTLFIRRYYNLKRNNGYSTEQIERKRMSLEGVLVPITSDWNIDMLKQTGFSQVDTFWRWMNFTGIVAIK